MDRPRTNGFLLCKVMNATGVRGNVKKLTALVAGDAHPLRAHHDSREHMSYVVS